MCFRKEKDNDNNEKKSILNNTNNDLFNNYNSLKKNHLFKKDDCIIEFRGIDLNKLILEIEKYINSWFNKSNFKVMGSSIINNNSYYILIDKITKDTIKIRYTLIDYDPIKILVINEVIHSV